MSVQSTFRLDGIVIARSHRASKDARPFFRTGYGDAAIQNAVRSMFPWTTMQFNSNLALTPPR